MSNPYGPPPGAAQSAPGPYAGHGHGPASWGPGQSVPSYAGPASSDPAYGHVPDGPPVPPQRPEHPPKAKAPIDLGTLIPTVVGALGLLGFIFGFLPGLKTAIGDGLGTSATAPVYATQGYLPILVLVVGLLALAPLLPGGKKYTLPTALLALAGLLGAATALISGSSGPLGVGTSAGFGLVLLLVVAVLQTAAAGYGWFLDSGLAKGRSTKPAAQPIAPTFGGYSTPVPGPGSVPSGPAASPPPTHAHAAPLPEAPVYGGYGPGAYAPSPAGVSPAAPSAAGGPPAAPSPAGPPPVGQPTAGAGSYGTYRPYTAPAAGPAPTYGTGATPAPDTAPARESSAPTALTDQHGREQPGPDVTQQVRF